MLQKCGALKVGVKLACGVQTVHSARIDDLGMGSKNSSPHSKTSEIRVRVRIPMGFATYLEPKIDIPKSSIATPRLMSFQPQDYERPPPTAPAPAPASGGVVQVLSRAVFRVPRSTVRTRTLGARVCVRPQQLRSAYPPPASCVVSWAKSHLAKKCTCGPGP